MNKLIRFVIPVHSFVDLITNSSSEIFTSASDSTVAAAKEIVNKVLAAGGSLATCDDLFNVSLLYHVRYYDNDISDTVEKEFNTEAEVNAFKDANEDSFCGDYDVCWNDLVIEAKDSANEQAKAAAKSLEGFFGTYSTWEQSN